MLYTPSLIQTILSVPGSHRFVQPQGAACRLYCRWGITPRLEDKYSFVHWDIVYTCMGEIASTFLDENLYRFFKFYKKDFTKSKSCSIIKKKGAMDVRARQVSCSFTGHRPEKLPWGDRESDRRCRALQERLFQAVQTAYERLCSLPCMTGCPGERSRPLPTRLGGDLTSWTHLRCWKRTKTAYNFACGGHATLQKRRGSL